MKCIKCGKEAAFFHSKCCGVHFEGVVKEGRKYIACESCMKICGRLE